MNAPCHYLLIPTVLPRILFALIISPTIGFTAFKHWYQYQYWTPFHNYRRFFGCESNFIRPVWFKGDLFPSCLATTSGNRKRKKVKGEEGDVQASEMSKNLKTIKSRRPSAQRKSNYNKNQEKNNSYEKMIHIPMEIQQTVKVMIGSVSRILLIRN